MVISNSMYTYYFSVGIWSILATRGRCEIRLSATKFPIGFDTNVERRNPQNTAFFEWKALFRQNDEAHFGKIDFSEINVGHGQISHT